jgi:hypothetical protein
MAPILEIAYVRMNTWALPLRAAIDATPALKVVDAEWQMGPLSDLAFAISTHRGCIRDLIADIDDKRGLSSRSSTRATVRSTGYVRRGLQSPLTTMCSCVAF